MHLYQLLLVSLVFATAKASLMLHNYKMALENLQTCPQNDDLEMSVRNLRSRSNRTHTFLSYDVNYTRPLDEKVGGSVVVERWRAGNWVTVPFLAYHKDICGYFSKYLEFAWVSWHRAMGVTNPEQCPVPAGSYSVRDFLFDLDNYHVKAIPFWSGRFRATAYFKDADTMEDLYCIVVILSFDEVIG